MSEKLRAAALSTYSWVKVVAAIGHPRLRDSALQRAVIADRRRTARQRDDATVKVDDLGQAKIADRARDHASRR